jgi:hypothetical protein
LDIAAARGVAAAMGVISAAKMLFDRGRRQFAPLLAAVRDFREIERTQKIHGVIFAKAPEAVIPLKNVLRVLGAHSRDFYNPAWVMNFDTR